MAGAYYNEFDPYAAQWLRNLIRDGLIAPGDVDTRSIEDVKPDDLRNYTQCHFFAGVGLWSHALRLAGWPDDRPIWTGSCPCQPFSSAGKGDGFGDERHLWPAFFHLIAQCGPAAICGEQVASKDGYAWLDLVQTDVEGLGYAFWPVVLPVAGVGGPHERHRQWWVGLADAERAGLERHAGDGDGATGREAPERPVAAPSVPIGLANAPGGGFGAGGGAVGTGRGGYAHSCESLDALDDRRRPGPLNGFWRDADWLFCTDGKWRPVESGSRPLAHGLPRSMGTLGAGLERICAVAGVDKRSLDLAKQYRVGTLRGYGNAICSEAAAEFIRAWMGVAP